MSFYSRRLPHWQPPDKAMFLTWRLFDSLPAKVMARLHEERTGLDGKDFFRTDNELDKSRSGPQWLSIPDIARSVIATLRRGDQELRQYDLKAFVVMPNHVHALLHPRCELHRVTNGLKGVTAREANRILGRTGKHFWQDETYDHWIRDGRQFDRVRLYIERNPVTAGLAKAPEDWPWSSAHTAASPGSPRQT